MRKFVLRFSLLMGAVAAASLAAAAQDDSPSLGDLARQARQQKQKAGAHDDASGTAPNAPKTGDANPLSSCAPSKDQGKDLGKDQNKDPQPADKDTTAAAHKFAKRVITNEEIPEHVGPTSTRPNHGSPNYNSPQPAYYRPENPAAAEQWKSSIRSMKDYIANMESQIANLEHSIHYSEGNCVSDCVQWNERQRQKQQQAESMKEQVQEQQKRLEEMQEQARRQGFGSAVYDP